MKNKFNDTVTRDQKAAEYFSSEEFYNLMVTAAGDTYDKRTRGSVSLFPKVRALPKDMPYIENAFARLKAEHPEFDHIRINRGVGATIGRCLILGILSACETRKNIVIDTKKNTLGRRIGQGFSPVEPVLSNGLQARYM